MNNEFISASPAGRGWVFTVPSRLYPGSRARGLVVHSTRAAAIAAGRREYPHIKKVVK